MSYSAESVQMFWAMIRAARPRAFLVRRLLQRLERGEIDEREAADWIASARNADRRQLCHSSYTGLGAIVAGEGE